MLGQRVDPLRPVPRPRLQPAVTVVPDLATLDLDAHDPSAGDRDHEVGLMVLLVIGDPLTVDHQIVVGQLVTQREPHRSLGGRGEPRGLGEHLGHGDLRSGSPALCQIAGSNHCFDQLEAASTRLFACQTCPCTCAKTPSKMRDPTPQSLHRKPNVAVDTDQRGAL